MNRRALLATIGTGFAGLAGCSDVGEFRLPEDGDTATPTARPPATADGSLPPCSEEGWGYEQDLSPAENLRQPAKSFAAYDCPTFDWADRSVCYHTATLPEEDVVLVPQDETVTVTEDGGAVGQFVLVNRAGDGVRTDPGTWTVLEPTDDGWTLLKGGGPTCTRRLDDGDGHWWYLNAAEDSSREIDVTSVSLAIEPGVYALAVPAFLPDGDDIMCATLFVAERIEPTTPVIGDDPTPIPIENTSLTED